MIGAQLFKLLFREPRTIDEPKSALLRDLTKILDEYKREFPDHSDNTVPPSEATPNQRLPGSPSLYMASRCMVQLPAGFNQLPRHIEKAQMG